MDLFVSQTLMLLGERNKSPEVQGTSSQGRPAWRAPLCTSPESASGFERTERVRKSGREPRRSPGPILDGSGDGIPHSGELSRRRHRHQAAGRRTRGRKGATPFLEREPQRSAARKHPTATTAGCPNSMEVRAALACSTALVQQRSRMRIATGMVLLTIRWGLTLSPRLADPHEDHRRRRVRLAINSECEWTLRAL